MIRRNWRSSWYALLVTGSFFCGPVCGPVNPVFAQEPDPEPALTEKVCDPDKPENCSRPINAGDVAPFAGQLLTTDLAIDLGQKAANCDKRIVIEVERVKGLAENDLALETKLHQIDKDGDARTINLLEDRLKEAKKIPWYERPAFVAVTTAVLTVAASVAIFQTAARAN